MIMEQLRGPVEESFYYEQREITESFIGMLRRDHSLILGKCIPEIESHFEHLLGAGTIAETLALAIAWKWFGDFRLRLRDHFEMEEKIVFPYLLKKSMPANAESAIAFMHEHDNYEEQLQEYVEAIEKGLSPLKNDLAFSVLLQKLKHLREQLYFHGIQEHSIMK